MTKNTLTMIIQNRKKKERLKSAPLKRIKSNRKQLRFEKATKYGCFLLFIYL